MSSRMPTRGGQEPAAPRHPRQWRADDPIETRKKRVNAEASRLAGLGATISGAFPETGLDHYAVGMKDPEGNEFDIN